MSYSESEPEAPLEVIPEEKHTVIKPAPVQEPVPEKPKRTRRTKKQIQEEQAQVPPPTPKPKRKCTAKQLAALAAGRAKNKHFRPKQKEEDA